MARERMGFDFGLESPNLCLKRKFRWLFIIPDVSSEGVNTLPPEKGARPSLSFKEVEAQHLNEVVYFPGKPDWKPINLTLYDLRKNNNPVINWLQEVYNPQTGRWRIGFGGGGQFKKDAKLEMYDGCGNVLESWQFENIWPNNIEWGELDMADSNYVTIDITLRYDRAYVTI
jgi:hypothetical protein